MKIAAVYCVINEEEFIEYSINSVYDHVDKVVVILAREPRTILNPDVMKVFKPDRTEEIVDNLARNNDKIVVFKGVWQTEMDQRNVGMEYCIQNGIDYYLLIDADEAYRADHLEYIKSEVEKHPEVGVFLIRCSTFWRSFHYRIPYQKMKWVPWRLFKITRYRRFLFFKFPYHCRFIESNKTNSLGKIYKVDPEKAIFYHFGYSRSTERMKLKIMASEVTHKFRSDWFENVWMKWPQNKGMKNLQPLDPDDFPEAVYVKPDDLPEPMKKHPYYGMEVIP